MRRQRVYQVVDPTMVLVGITRIRLDPDNRTAALSMVFNVLAAEFMLLIVKVVDRLPSIER